LFSASQSAYQAAMRKRARKCTATRTRRRWAEDGVGKIKSGRRHQSDRDPPAPPGMPNKVSCIQQKDVFSVRPLSLFLRPDLRIPPAARGGAVKAALLARLSGLGLDGPEHGAKVAQRRGEIPFPRVYDSNCIKYHKMILLDNEP
jgi:hypothetical protein